MEILNERLDLKRIGQQFNVTAIMISWTRQPSYPIVRCTGIANGRIRLSQIPHPGLLDGNHTQLWWIPLAIGNRISAPKACFRVFGSRRKSRLWRFRISHQAKMKTVGL